MLGDKQSFIVRPKAVPSMFTPVLTPNSQSSSSSNTMHSTNNRLSQEALVEIGTLIRKHDQNATQLYDLIGQVKLFAYNSTELRWENSPNIAGGLFIYEKQQLINNKMLKSYAFAIIHGDKSLIQPITSDMVQHADKLRLFFEVARNDRREVFCLHFLSEAECASVNANLNRCIQASRVLEEQQSQQIRTMPTSVPTDSQTQLNGQMSAQQTPPNIYRQQMPQQTTMPRNPTPPQYGSPRAHISQAPMRANTLSNVTIQQQPTHPHSSQVPIDVMSANRIRTTPNIQPTNVAQIDVPKPIEQTPFPPSPVPLSNGNNANSEDPSLSLKRLLNIRGQNPLENLPVDDSSPFTKQQSQSTSVDLMPPSAFEPISATPSSPIVAIGAERTKHRLSAQLPSIMSREHFRNVLLHLVQTDDNFLDIIYQACLAHPPPSTQ